MSQQVGCRCGRVRIELEREPIIAAECHCNSCRDAAGRMATLPGAPAVTEPNGGTRYVVYRKDRVRFVSGFEQLHAFTLGPERTTRRVVATCCDTPVFVEFKGGHWLSLYSLLWPAGTAPDPDLRSMTGDRTDTVPLDDTVPAGGWATAKFYARLAGAWIGMGFKVPKLELEGRKVVFRQDRGR